MNLSPASTELLLSPDISDFDLPGLGIEACLECPVAIIIERSQADDEILIEEGAQDVNVDNFRQGNDLAAGAGRK